MWKPRANNQPSRSQWNEIPFEPVKWAWQRAAAASATADTTDTRRKCRRSHAFSALQFRQTDSKYMSTEGYWWDRSLKRRNLCWSNGCFQCQPYRRPTRWRIPEADRIERRSWYRQATQQRFRDWGHYIFFFKRSSPQNRRVSKKSSLAYSNNFRWNTTKPTNCFLDNAVSASLGSVTALRKSSTISAMYRVVPMKKKAGVKRMM